MIPTAGGFFNDLLSHLMRDQGRESESGAGEANISLPPSPVPLCPSGHICMHLFYKSCPLSLARSTSPQVNGALLKLTTPKDIQAHRVRDMIYDFLPLITTKPPFPYMKRIMSGFVCIGLSGFVKVCTF